VLEVHPPNEPVHGWRDFLIHLATITIGLLIALSLEGCVEFWHHRSLVHEAEASMQIEIEANARQLQGALDDVRKEQDFLKQDIAVMKRTIANPKVPNKEDMRVDFRIRTFADVSWKTSQSTGALSYMPYESAEKYASIYSAQNEIAEAELWRSLEIPGSPFAASYAIQSPVMDAEGKRLHVANGTDVDCFLVDASSGALTEIGLSFTNGRAIALALDGPDNFLYVLDNVDNQIEVFSIDPTGGSLALIAGSPFALFPGASNQNLAPNAITVQH